MSTADTLADALARIVDPLAARVVQLEAAVAALQARPTLAYRGVWQPEETYTPGEFVSFSGSLWHANDVNTGVRPGQPDAASRVWKLAVQRGRPGKASK